MSENTANYVKTKLFFKLFVENDFYNLRTSVFFCCQFHLFGFLCWLLCHCSSVKGTQNLSFPRFLYLHAPVPLARASLLSRDYTETRSHNWLVFSGWNLWLLCVYTLALCYASQNIGHQWTALTLSLFNLCVACVYTIVGIRYRVYILGLDNFMA